MKQITEEHRLLVLGSLEEFAPLVEEARHRKYHTIVCDGYPRGKAKSLADKAYTINISDIDRITDLCREERIDGIITSFSDALFEQATRIAEATGLRWYMDAQRLPYYRNKQVMKDTLRRLGISIPAGKVL